MIAYTESKIQKNIYNFGQISWPPFMPYLKWQKHYKKHLELLSSGSGKKSHKKGLSKGISKRLARKNMAFLKASIQRLKKAIKIKRTCLKKRPKDKNLEKKILSGINPGAENSPKAEKIKYEIITLLKKFMEKTKIFQLIENHVVDKRNQDQIKYTKETLIMAALSIFLLRLGSGNKFDEKSRDQDAKYAQKNISCFINSTEDLVPAIRTIENFLQTLKEDYINNMMISFFKELMKSKFFIQNRNIMIGDFFLLAADCVHTHTYDHPHHTDEEGNHDCPCCLKRVYNKGTENETVRWIHNTLVYSFVFWGGLKIPIYSYPIHAKQIRGFEADSENNHKQECELVALKITLPIIRSAFQKMKIMLSLDGLYANRPVIKLAEEYNCGYIIVRKEKCLPTFVKDCEDRRQDPNHKNCKKRTKTIDNQGFEIVRKYEWFNSIYVETGSYTNILRYSEIKTKEGEKSKKYNCEWLFSSKISSKTCEDFMRQARARWEIEDVFNTLKNRGYEFKHDYSRNPRSCFIWHALALFAYGIFELFRLSEAIKDKGPLSDTTIVDKLKYQIFGSPTEEIFDKLQLSTRIQFRYNIIVVAFKFQEAPLDDIQDVLLAG